MPRLHSLGCAVLLSISPALVSSPVQAEAPSVVKFQNEENTATHESLIQEHLATLQELNTVLQKVKDEATAQTNQADIEKIAAKMKTVKDKADKLGKPTPEQEKMLKEKYEADVKKSSNDVLTNIFRIAKDEAALKIVQAALQPAE